MYEIKESIEIIVPSPDTESGEKLCIVRQPTAEEWSARYQQRINVIKNLGNGVTQSEVLNREKADATLLKAIQQNKDVTFDDSEAIAIIEQLANCDVVNIEKIGRSYEITLQTILGDVVHQIKVPYHKDLRKATEGIVKARGGKFNTTMLHMNLVPAAELYDSHAEKIEGYDTENPKEVPIVHKYKVVDVIQGEINNITAKSKVSGSESFPSTPGQTNLT